MKNFVLKTAVISSLLSAFGVAGFYVPKKCDQTLDKSVYHVCYDYQAKGAKGVWYHLNGSLVDKLNIRKRPRFYSEHLIPSRYRTKPADYSYAVGSKDCSGMGCSKVFYNRGHMAPDAGFDYDPKVLRKVYSMANIVPQIDVVNQKLWEKAENQERIKARQLGSLDVSNIVIYGDPDNYLVKKPIEAIKGSDRWSAKKIAKYKYWTKKLAQKHILVPTGFIKVLENRDKGFKQCFFYKNAYPSTPVSQDLLYAHAFDCSKLKKFNLRYITGE